MFTIKVCLSIFTLVNVFVALLLISGRYRKVSNKIDRWISTESFFGRMDYSIRIERFLLNRLTGILVLIGSSYIVIYNLFYSGLTGWPGSASKAFSLIFGLTGIFVGLALSMGGKTILKINDKMSTWISTERLFRPMDKIIEADTFFYKHNISVGILLLFACLLINLRLWLAF